MFKNIIKRKKNKKQNKGYRKNLFVEKMEKKYEQKRKKRNSKMRFIDFFSSGNKKKQLKIYDINLRRKKKQFFYTICIIFLTIILILLFFSSIFRVKTINIVRKDDITNINIAYKALENIRGQSIFLIDRKKIQDRLKSYQKNIKNLKIEIKLPNTIKILVGSYEKLFNTKIRGKNYVIIKNGVLIPTKSSEELKNLKIVGKIRSNGIIDYKKILNTEHLKNIEKIIKGIEKNIIGIKIESLTYYIRERELHLFIENKTRIIFDLTSQVGRQIEKIVIFNKENFKLKNKKIFYIDLRVKSKIFYCEESIRCKKNLKKIYYD